MRECQAGRERLDNAFSPLMQENLHHRELLRRKQVPDLFVVAFRSRDTCLNPAAQHRKELERERQMLPKFQKKERPGEIETPGKLHRLLRSRLGFAELIPFVKESGSTQLRQSEKQEQETATAFESPRRLLRELFQFAQL